MHIVQLVDKLGSSGGVPSFVYDLCFALKEVGCSITLIGILSNESKIKAPYKELKKAGINVIELNAPNKKKAIAKYIPKLRYCIKNIAKTDKTILNMHLKLSVLMGCFASVGLKNISCIETYHNTYRHYHLQFNTLRPFIKKYITVSETARRELINDFHAPVNKVVAAPNGIDCNKIRRMAGAPEKHDYLSIVSVGRLSYEKNFTVPVEAFSKICSPAVRYTMIGDGPDREKVISASHGNRNIVFTGALPRNEVLKHLASADIVVMPSLWEGRSILQMEAMAFDAPLIISDVPGLREPFGERKLDKNELCRKCDFGFLVRTNEQAAYIQAIQSIIENKSELEVIRKHINMLAEKIDIKTTAEKYISVYKSVIFD